MQSFYVRIRAKNVAIGKLCDILRLNKEVLMKKQRYIFLLLTAFFIYPSEPVNAQIRPNNMNWEQMRQAGLHKKNFPEMKWEKIDWAKKLKLDDGQKIQLQKIYDQSKPQTYEIMQQIENLHQKLNEVRQTEEENIRQILNDKQKAKFDKYRARIDRQYRKTPPPPDKHTFKIKQ
jgi:hypothetical protein